MIHNFVRNIGGIGNLGVISILLFFAVFTGALLWACFQKKSFLKSMASLPLEDGEKAATTKGDTRHE